MLCKPQYYKLLYSTILTISVFDSTPLTATVPQNIVSQSTPGTTLEKGQTTQIIPIPVGYIDAMAPGSPGVEFLEDLRQDWRKRDFTPTGLISVLVKTSDIESYYNGGLNPLDGHYVYICFLGSNNPLQEMANIKQNILVTSGKITSDVNKLIKQLKYGEMSQLGVVEEWETGFVYGYLAYVDIQGKSKSIKKAKLLLTSVVSQAHGGYFVNDVSVIDSESDLHVAVDRIKNLAKQIAAANALSIKSE
jgi:hypothetical protein